MKRYLLALIGGLFLSGCCSESFDPKPTTPAKETVGILVPETKVGNQKETNTPQSQTIPKTVQVGPGVFLEVDGEIRTVVISSKVVRREGFLELLLCREKTKEHESILAAPVDARDVHSAMLSAGMKPGSPVQFLPEYKAATGTKLEIRLRFNNALGQNQLVFAKDWINKTMVDEGLQGDWVFSGSRLIPNTQDPKAPPYFLANDGDLISISNFESALMDLAIKVSSADGELAFEPWEKRIPEIGTPVAVLIRLAKTPH